MPQVLPEPEIDTDQIEAANERAFNRIRASMAAFLAVEEIESELLHGENPAYTAKSSSLGARSPRCLTRDDSY